VPKEGPKFEVNVEGLVMRPHASLHHRILGRVAVYVGAFYFVGMIDVPVVSFEL